MALSGDESKMLEKVSQDLKLIMETEKIGALELEIISNVTWPMIRRAIHAKGNYGVEILIKMLNALGYTITLTKTKKPIRANENPVLMQKLIDKRKYNKNATRRKRDQPEQHGTPVVTKPIAGIAALSGRKKVEEFKSQNDFLVE